MLRYFLVGVVFAFSLSSHATAADPVTLLLEAPSAIKLVGEYLGVIESLESKVDRIIDADLKTAVSLFEQAQANPDKCAYLIKEARILFTRAAAIQSDSMDETRRYKRALALLGLWSSCMASGDEVNAKRTLEDVATISDAPSLTMALKFQSWEAVTNSASTLFSPYPRIRVYPPSVDEYRKFSEDYDSLLDIISAADKKLQSIQEKANPPSIVGKWKSDNGLIREFLPDGSLSDGAKTGKSNGTYELLDGRKIKCTTEGLFYGTNVVTWNYRLYSDTLIMKMTSANQEVSFRYKRAK